MKLEKIKEDSSKAIFAIFKSLLGHIPGVSELFAGYDGYKKSVFDRTLKKGLEYLRDKVDNIDFLFSSEWLKTKDGQMFVNKIFDSILDAQLEEKQELFLNALINGIQKKDLDILEKFKFVDILRHVSKLSLMVLADIYKFYYPKISSTNKSMQIMPENVVEQISDKYKPYAITASIDELAGQGLFSDITGWYKREDGFYLARGHIQKGSYLYTEYTTEFVKFILLSECNYQS